jgi:hypothetical protein
MVESYARMEDKKLQKFCVRLPLWFLLVNTHQLNTRCKQTALAQVTYTHTHTHTHTTDGCA